jgi:cardiolipin synthase (CMP-forming)
MSFLPNALTILRLLAAGPLVWCIVQEHEQAAFWLALGAGASDLLDGWIAKRFGWTSRLGAILDPLADKVLLLAALIGLTHHGVLPVWLLGLALARDLCLVLGGMVYHWRYEKLTPQPSVPGKLTTLVLVLLIVVALAAEAFALTDLNQLVTGLTWSSGALLGISWIHYWLVWSPRSRSIAARRNNVP